MLEVRDEEHRVQAVSREDGGGEVDLSVLEMRGEPHPWQGLEMRAASSVPVGERLCTWRMQRGATGVLRERICARLESRETRSSGEPRLVLSHPYPAGTSGSPLLDGEDRVVGIVVASTGLTGLAEPIEGIVQVLARADRRPKATPTPAVLLEVSPATRCGKLRATCDSR